MFKVQTLNNISSVGLAEFPAQDYDVGGDHTEPHAIVLRSFQMHDMPIPQSLLAVGRAGAGVNNIPIGKLAESGIPVFNSPGANANAVKELVIAGMLMSCRNLCDAWDYTRKLNGNDSELSSLVEAGKKKYAGSELPGRTIGVIGLGAIGRMVANACIGLGMNVIGYDPALTVDGAWQLSSDIKRANSVEELLSAVDFVTLHVPLTDSTRDMLNADNIGRLGAGATVINMARGGIVNDEAICNALDGGRLHAYVTDFPSARTQACERVVGLPHLGASTREAEDNCAVMVVRQLCDFLNNGNIVNSVNFPNVSMPRGSDHRMVIANANVPNMVGQISTAMADASLNIHDMINQSRGDIAYTIVDVDSPIGDDVVRNVAAIDGVMRVRVL